MVYTATSWNNYKDVIILPTLYLYWRGYILLASKYLFRGIQFVPNYCIRYYRSNNSLVLFSILLLVLVSRINLSILTRYSYSRNSNILYTEFYHISQGKSISCYGPNNSSKGSKQDCWDHSKVSSSECLELDCWDHCKVSSLEHSKLDF